MINLEEGIILPMLFLLLSVVVNLKMLPQSSPLSKEVTMTSNLMLNFDPIFSIVWTKWDLEGLISEKGKELNW